MIKEIYKYKTGGTHMSQNKRQSYDSDKPGWW